MVDMKKIALFAAGTLFGSAGFKLLSSSDAKKVYTQTTAAVLRMKDSTMETVSKVQEHDQSHPRGKGSEGSGGKELKQLLHPPARTTAVRTFFLCANKNRPGRCGTPGAERGCFIWSRFRPCRKYGLQGHHRAQERSGYTPHSGSPLPARSRP